MHKLFVSDAIVLGKRGAGESNVLISVLAEDLGLVRASARSARREDSKLRYALEPLSFSRMSFVRGKHEWKLVGAEGVSHLFSRVSLNRRRAAGRISKLLTRLIHGEEHTPGLFISVKDGLTYLAAAQTESEAENIECMLVLRILSHLGYLPQNSEVAKFIEKDFFSLELAQEIERSRALIIRTINESLGATGL